MMFNSVAYLLFLPIAALLYFIIPPKFRNAYLLAASYYFYTCWEPKYALLLLGSTLISYFAGRLISSTKQNGEKGCTLTLGKKSFSCGFNLRKLWLGIALFFNVGILFLYKYLDFASDIVNRLMSALGIDMQLPLLGLLQPIGISFFTFKALSYVIDVYKGKISEEKNKRRRRINDIERGGSGYHSEDLPDVPARLIPLPDSTDPDRRRYSFA